MILLIGGLISLIFGILGAWILIHAQTRWPSRLKAYEEKLQIDNSAKLLNEYQKFKTSYYMMNSIKRTFLFCVLVLIVQGAYFLIKSAREFL